jgi:elongator complex protein 3
MVDLSVFEKSWRENLQKLLLELVEKVKIDEKVTDLDLLRLQRKYALGKEAVQPFYLKAEILSIFKQEKARLLAEKEITTKIVKELERILQVKPVRTQSGVATVTVLTKPWPCPGKCIFCPSEARMPKSYLANEPGAQRAEHNYFDPFLQVTSRLQNLKQMGHNLSKVELIVLGGTWDNYPLLYRIWFVKRMFEALNNFGESETEIQEIWIFMKKLIVN